ncbi:MAG: hypothetical protein JO089_01985 [Alphaproteobacteria bacterium]|nr:hypothetical protein [Alphaproteobacteria bacterium]
MSVTSINTNLAAYYAQQNISSSQESVTLSVARLSSGNAIQRASDDVAGLAIGTTLSSNVSTLKVAQQNVSQGTSLLQVADGALQQVTSILQRQQQLATQAASGSLTDTERGFLNQEFQSLAAEINSIAGTTNFNGLNLIDGSLAGQVGVSTNATTTSTAVANNSGTIATMTAGIANGDTMTVNGVVVTFVTAGTSPGSSAAQGKVIIGASAADTAANVAAYLNGLNDPRIANLQFTAGGTANLSANYTGGVMVGGVKIVTSASNAAHVTGTGTTTFTPTTLPDTTDANGLGVNRYAALGTVTGSLLVDGAGTATDFGSAIDVSTVKNNAAFIGKLGTGQMGAIQGSYAGAQDTAVFSVKVGNITYTTAGTVITGGAAPIALTFTGADSTGAAAGGSFTLNLKGTAVTAASINGQSDLDPITAQLNSALSGVTFVQNRSVTSFQNGGTISVGGVEVGNLVGASLNVVSGNFSTPPQVSSISVSAPSAGTADAKITMVINGDTYVSSAGIGSQIAKNTVIGLQDVNDPTKTVAIVTGNTAISSTNSNALDLSTQANATAFQNALSQAVGLNSSNASLNFQVGTSSSNVIGVKIGSATSNSLYNGQPLDLLTQNDASAAGTAIGAAINSITAIRANVGALQESFNFASANLTSSVQNQDAARSQFLDTNIATESTNFATEQVKLQAGISTLAQANQELQNLLKLIG